jgi:structural maintenance of chromosome 4
MNLPSCKVSVHFVEIKDKDENGEEYEIIEGSELEVSRAAFSDNTNKYYINGRGSNYKEVTDLLKKAGIDLDHNRFLILQGEVELISLMPPKARNENETGMLEYLEDIIGSNRLIEEIEVTAPSTHASYIYEYIYTYVCTHSSEHSYWHLAARVSPHYPLDSPHYHHY